MCSQRAYARRYVIQPDPMFVRFLLQGFALRNALPVFASLADLFPGEELAALLCDMLLAVQTTRPALNIDKLTLLRCALGDVV